MGSEADRRSFHRLISDVQDDAVYTLGEDLDGRAVYWYAPMNEADDVRKVNRLTQVSERYQPWFQVQIKSLGLQKVWSEKLLSDVFIAESNIDLSRNAA